MFEKFTATLIEDWKRGYKFLCLRVNAVIASVALAWQCLPDDQKVMMLQAVPFIGSKAMVLVIIIAFLVSTYARLKQQPELHQPAA